MADKKKYSKKNSKSKTSLKNERKIKIGLIIVIILFGIIIYKIFNKTILTDEAINLSGEKYYQYFLGLKQTYSGKIKLVQNKEENKIILEDKSVVYLDSTPMYYEDILGKALFAEDMELVAVDDSMYKIKKFTNIIQENDTIYSKKHNKKDQKALINSFIYDGEDLYFFLEETTVKVGDSEYILSPLSYAIVSYKDSVELYNYDKDEYIMINDTESVQQDVIAINNIGNYEINMSVDSVISTKEQKLLITNIKNLPELEY